MVERDSIKQELLKCNGDIRCVNKKLDKLPLFVCEFTLEEISVVLLVARERVRQIESSVIKKLKHPKIGRKLKIYLHEI